MLGPLIAVDAVAGVGVGGTAAGVVGVNNVVVCNDVVVVVVVIMMPQVFFFLRATNDNHCACRAVVQFIQFLPRFYIALIL